MVTTTILITLIANNRYLINYFMVALAFTMYLSAICVEKGSTTKLLFNGYIAYDSLTSTIAVVAALVLIGIVSLYFSYLHVNLPVKSSQRLVLTSHTKSFSYEDKGNTGESAPKLNNELLTLMMLLMVSLAALASSNSQLALFVAIELQSLVLYILLATNLIPVGTILSNTSKVSLSYLINAAMATAFLLLGMASNSSVLVLIAIVWKLGVIPVHVWSIPILDNQHSLITATYLTLAKYGTLVVIGLVASSSTSATSLLIYVGLANLVIGNILGLLQHRYQRIIVYSSLIQIGYMLLVLSTNASVALTYFEMYSFYTIVLLVLWALPSYSITNASALMPSVYLWLMVLTLYTVAGLPFMPLFWTKLDVLLNVSTQAVTFALLSTLLSSLIYVRLIKYMAFNLR